ncbi:GntR family transcriptional regulator [Actinacidiphila sp. DG2A-62]|uniref:GntR family transcriptional regulator n=1 Tax=Actinacidiphila sp. DG2A-62 TaxID=3108821 RepID=UPI002DBD8FE1|nr:GntR family transcriptional regulator [Actinacidiphila sp. DG2A-62]MEC3994638.1 GntR family transcriptional regulator [Actinacidiphila sp. DG2A-62]
MMERMEPQPTAVPSPIHLRIADDIRMQIERGDLAPGDSLPTLADLSERWSCSMNSARSAVALLKAQGLITAGRGKAPVVRIAPGRVVRSSERHQAEKDLARRPERERADIGEAETNLGMSIDAQEFGSEYEITEATPELAELFGVNPKEPILRRRFVSTDKRTGHLLSYSTSYIPVSLISANPALLDGSNEPWPGGTQHQLSTVGIEIMCMVDQVTGRMPTTVEVQQWGLPDGVPLLICRRISIDADNRTVEISDAEYPADRTELRFVTPLKPWRRNSQPKK